MRHLLYFLTLISLLGPIPVLRADDAGIEFFEKKIRPVLVEHCYECHATGAKKIRGGLLLDSREGWKKGGESGPAIDPGHPDKSLLIKALRYTDDMLKMPPRGKLPAAVITDFETWVKMGAPDPREKPVAAKVAKSWEETVRVRRDWWSLHPIKDVAVPKVKNAAWSKSPIDQFILAKLEEAGLSPAEPADPHTLARRLSLVLTGLPPTPQQTAECVQDPRKLVDSLLASPHFGERWARHWMDVVRFSETHGNEWNYDVHHAWRYRDYLIRAFNADLPYDQFIREHIAGDLLKPRWNVKEKFNEAVIGTAFYRFGEVNHDDCVSLRQIGYDLADNQIDTLTKAFQATTVACARCHDHKLDAVSMRDYYGLLGVIRSARCVSHTIDAPEVNEAIVAKMRDKKAAIRKELAKVWLSESKRIIEGLLHAALAERLGEAKPAGDVDAAALKKLLVLIADEKAPLEEPFSPLRLLIAFREKDKLSFEDAWKKVAEQIDREDGERLKFNQRFTTLADFRKGTWPDWQVGGMAQHGGPSPAGDFVVAVDGNQALTTILPSGCFTHAVSDKLNGTLRSPSLFGDKKRISLQVMGQNSSGVRLVSNNCQLNYTNFRVLTSNQLGWVSFSVSGPDENLRPYAELMTMLDNPKFPDQLATLAGGKMDFRVPFEKAAANPRSFFGVTRVVIHDEPGSPKAELGHFRGVFAGSPIAAAAELAERYTHRLEEAVRKWGRGEADDEDVRWLEPFLRHGLLSNNQDLTPVLKDLVAGYRRLDGELAIPRVVPGLADGGPGFSQPMFVRGDCLKPGETVPRRFVEVLAPAPISSTGSGRLELANILASADNPLTARVMVNRIWHHLFGAGLVRTVDDFGHVGDAPSHPELLDYLAKRFVAESWSMKRLIREIVLTKTFQMSHHPTTADLERDPLNRLLARYAARRMEAEAVRDSILATSGRLDLTQFGMSIPAYREKDNADRRLFRGPLDGNGRRSIYIRFTLMESPRFLDAFDLPGGKVTQGRRDVTNVPAQALAMLNDPFVLGQAEFWGKRLVERKDDSLAERIGVMFRGALGREPRSEERERVARFVSRMAALHNVAGDQILVSMDVWRDVGHVIFNMQEFITIP